MDESWIALIVPVGVCILSWLWSLLLAPRFNVHGKHVLFTGAETSLSLAIAKKYIKKGANVSLIGPSMGSFLKAELQKLAGPTVSIFMFECDLVDSKQVQEAVEEANAFHGRPTDHIVYVTSTRMKPGYFWEQDVALMKEAMDINYYGAVVLLKAALPAMIEAKTRGRIVFVSSVDTFKFPIGSGAYSSSINAIRGLADSLRNELLLYNISVAVFYPGTSSDNVLDTSKESKALKQAPQEDCANDNDISTDYSTFTDHSSASTKLSDKEAQVLINGLWFGQYSITTTWDGFLLRMLSNGVAPRNNTFLESICLFLTGVFYSTRQMMKERSLKKPVHAGTAAFV
ncbi:unnamed protein product [Peronospora belbahrii]|uniref:3-ketodihydrosphingosine reductase n=1 Tax=Peronospora belbahrii TaxID=622444 RepID=A0AAU9LBF9_9STRA|nr:unnamed protein product [Peronospora belbahrii]CAH0522254.1 unnamed protein product [Peronospora belbahrii]